MTGLGSALADFKERYPRATSVVYQFLLVVITFECALSIARYDPNPAGSPILYPPKDGFNSTAEHICKISAREADVPVGFLRYVIPIFMLCPTTPILVGVCVAFVLGILRLYYFIRDAPTPVMPYVIIITMINIDWERGFWISLQMTFPITTLIGVTITALFHPLFVRLLPGSYGAWTEHTKREREEREAQAARLKWRTRDIEEGQLEGADEETPLTGRGFVRDVNGALVENPVARSQMHGLYEEIRH